MVAPIDIISSAISLDGLTVNNNRNSVTIIDPTNGGDDEANSLNLSYSPSAETWTLDYSLDLADPTTLSVNEKNSTTWRDDIAQHIVYWRNQIQNYTTAADNIVLAFTAHKFAQDKDIEPNQLTVETAKEIIPRGWDYIPNGEIINDNTAHAMLSLQQPASPFVWTMTFVPNTYYMPCNIYDKQNNNNFNGVYHVCDIMQVFNASFTQERALRAQAQQQAQQRTETSTEVEPVEARAVATQESEQSAESETEQPANQNTTRSSSSTSTHSAINSAIHAQSLGYQRSQSSEYSESSYSESFSQSHHTSATRKLNSDINTAINSSLTNF